MEVGIAPAHVIGHGEDDVGTGRRNCEAGVGEQACKKLEASCHEAIMGLEDFGRGYGTVTLRRANLPSSCARGIRSVTVSNPLAGEFFTTLTPGLALASPSGTA